MKNNCDSLHSLCFCTFMCTGVHSKGRQYVYFIPIMNSNNIKSQQLITFSSTYWWLEGVEGRYSIPPVSWGSTPGPLSSWTCPENLQVNAPGRHPNQMPSTTSAGSFQRERAPSLLRAATECPSSSQRLSPAILWHWKLISNTRICNLSVLAATRSSWANVLAGT